MVEENKHILHKLWDVEQDILDCLHRFCVENNIVYTIGFGTLLGSIRHKGFIPWDDDIDVIMPRADYDKFIHLWKEKPRDGYVLLDEYSGNPHYGNNFSKLRKDHTTFIDAEKEKQCSYHKGIFIDIFPADRLSPSYFGRSLQYLASLVYMFCFRIHEYANTKNRLLTFIGNSTIFDRILMRNALKIITRWNICDNYDLFIPCALTFYRKVFPSNLFEEIDLLSFNGKLYFGTKNYDGFLRAMYGAYMTLPPVEDRVWRHHPIIIDFEHNFEELIREGKDESDNS